MRKLYIARKHPGYNAACFHSQQCAEKYLKARLVADLAVLNTYSVDLRYPGKTATKADAKDAIKRCRFIRSLVRQSFNLPI
jgi:HEPN domain-containing protein